MTRRAVIWAACVALAAGCDQRQIELVPAQADTNDHGFAALNEAVERLGEGAVTPERFRAFAVEVRGMRGAFNEDIATLAELYVAFRALAAERSVSELPREQRLERLALTVYPTAFRVEPSDGESVRDYLLRLCALEAPLECKDVVPEGWPLVMGAKARRALKLRAGEALTECRQCPNREAYREQLDAYDAYTAEEDAHAAVHERRYRPRRWPMAGARGAAWTPGAAPVFRYLDGDATLDGEPLTGDIRIHLRAARAGRDTLAVHLDPSDDMRRLQALADDARAAGYTRLAVLARAVEYPFELRAYPLELTGRARKADVRPFDTVQLLVRSLDANADEGPRRL